MNKKEFLEEILTKKYDMSEGGKNEGEVVPVWWIKHVFNDVFKNKSGDDDKYYKTSTCERDNSVDMGDVDEH